MCFLHECLLYIYVYLWFMIYCIFMSVLLVPLSKFYRIVNKWQFSLAVPQLQDLIKNNRLGFYFIENIYIVIGKVTLILSTLASLNN